jgi:hypothetical protein
MDRISCYRSQEMLSYRHPECAVTEEADLAKTVTSLLCAGFFRRGILESISLHG